MNVVARVEFSDVLDAQLPTRPVCVRCRLLVSHKEVDRGRVCRRLAARTVVLPVYSTGAPLLDPPEGQQVIDHNGEPSDSWVALFAMNTIRRFHPSLSMHDFG